MAPEPTASPAPRRSESVEESGNDGSDRDRDQIPDDRDRCPNDPETYNGYRDQEGCPDKMRGPLIDRGPGYLEFEKVHFQKGSSGLEHRFHDVLDSVAKGMDRHPEVILLEVQGHADIDEGKRALALSEQRARAVRDYLIEKRVAKERLTVVAYGVSQPHDKARNDRARFDNQRVTFRILERLPTPRE